MILGYNTNGFAHHALIDACEILLDLGYGGVALTPDVHHMNPFRADFERVYPPVRDFFAGGYVACVIETGARFLLDPLHKHQPTLISPYPEDRRSRLDYLTRCVALATELYGQAVSFWSGSPTDDADAAELMGRLAENCKRLADYAADKDVNLAFEPEPGMFIDTMDKFAELHAKVNHPNFGLTLDVGHLVCTGELPVRKHIEAWKHCLWNVHVEDMKPGVHDHLMFGEGEVDFADVFAGLRAIDYRGMVSVELSRHSYDAVNAARRAKAFLDPFLN